MSHDRLNYSRILLLVRQECREQAASEIVEAKPFNDFAVAVIGHAISYRNYTRSDRCGTNVILDKLVPLRGCSLAGPENPVSDLVRSE